MTDTVDAASADIGLQQVLPNSHLFHHQTKSHADYAAIKNVDDLCFVDPLMGEKGY